MIPIFTTNGHGVQVPAPDFDFSDGAPIVATEKRPSTVISVFSRQNWGPFPPISADFVITPDGEGYKLEYVFQEGGDPVSIKLSLHDLVGIRNAAATALQRLSEIDPKVMEHIKRNFL